MQNIIIKTMATNSKTDEENNNLKNNGANIHLNTNANVILFEGKFSSFADALEEAVAKGINLRHADLRYKDLQNANLDDGLLEHADFTGCNLSGINLSEAQLGGTIFQDTDLFNACFAYSNLTDANFTGARFGGTDITGAVMRRTKFNTTSCFTLDFRLARDIRGCRYIMPSGQICNFNQPPLIIHGGQQSFCAILDKHIINADRLNEATCQSDGKHARLTKMAITSILNNDSLKPHSEQPTPNQQKKTNT